MKIIINRFLPVGKKFHAINICGVLFAKGPCSAVTINHERIHTAQIKELAVIFFYLWYLAEWLARLVICRDSYAAYRNISFEREAYANAAVQDYLKSRKPWAFLSYMKGPNGSQ